MTIDLNIQKSLSESSNKKRGLEDNPLLEALTLVIESNAEYARGVTTILDSDLEKEVLLNEIKKEIVSIKKTVEKSNEAIIKFNEQLLLILEKLQEFDEELANKLREKLKPLYVAADLQESGEQYNPTDKLVITIKTALSSKIFTALAGIALWLLVKFIFEGVK